MLERRDFLKASVATTAALALTACSSAPLGAQKAAAADQPAPGKLARRPYGRHQDVRLSVVGLAGFALNKLEQPAADKLVAEAFDKGVNYYDVAPQYGDAEIKLGPALKPYRHQVFLACKTMHRSADKAREEFERSLQRLQTDYFDLYQLHAIRDPAKDVDAAFAKGGAMEMIEAEKKAGRIKYVGFSAHTVEAALAALDRYPFDSIMFPVTYHTWYAGNFGPEVLAKAKEKGVAVLAIKAMAKQAWTKAVTDANPEFRKAWSRCWYEPADTPEEARLGLRWTLSHPEVTAAIPPADERLVRLALEVGPTLPLTRLAAAEEDQYKALAAPLAPLFRYTAGKSREG